MIEVSAFVIEEEKLMFWLQNEEAHEMLLEAKDD